MTCGGRGPLDGVAHYDYSDSLWGDFVVHREDLVAQ